MATLPEVSLITSWHARAPEDTVPLPGLSYALRSGLSLLDLYFLNHTEIEWYIQAARRLDDNWTDHQRACPLSFAAALQLPDVKNIAGALLALLAGKDNTGRMVGPRPRFAALATYWPHIADDNEDYRRLSVLAVRNSLLLAAHLGCRHVEIVGGFAVSETVGLPDQNEGSRIEEDEEENDDAEDDPQDPRNRVAREARERRLTYLCVSLLGVFEPCWVREHLPDRQGPPWLCLEMEPGNVFLLNDLRSCHEVIRRLHKSGLHNCVLLNLDLAHIFLADAERRPRPGGTEPLDDEDLDQFQYLERHRPELLPLIGHFHISDHARTHASDLCPGTYHFFQPDYRPWLELAVELTGTQAGFSNTLAVEMEACSDIHDVLRAVGRTRSWLRCITQQPGLEEQNSSGGTRVEGTLLVVDIVNSTEVLAMGGVNDKAAFRLNVAVSALCQVIQSHRGSVYSFTGDGAVAIFDHQHYITASECASDALRAAGALFAALQESLDEAGEWDKRCKQGLALRVSLHWGHAVIPLDGPLRHQLLGPDVIIACRLLAAAEPVFASRLPDPGMPRYPGHRTHLAATKVFLKKVGLATDRDWHPLSESQIEICLRGIYWGTVSASTGGGMSVQRQGAFRKPRA